MKTDIQLWWIINQLYHFTKRHRDLSNLVLEDKFLVYIGGNDNFEKIFSEGEKNFMKISMSALKRRIVRRLFFSFQDDLERFWMEVENIINMSSGAEVGYIKKINDSGRLKLTLSAKGYQNYAFTSFLIGFITKYKLIAVIAWTAIIYVWSKF